MRIPFLFFPLLMLALTAACADAGAGQATTELGVVYRSPT
jgi:hypothetical protein